MAHFAELDSNDVVTRVIVVANSDTADASGVEDEAIGIAYLKGLFGENTKWAQTSYNGNIRGRYAGVGFTFDSVNDLFIPPQPYPSWILDANTKEWKAPMPEPELTSGMIENGQIWLWDEENGEWKESEATVAPPAE